MASLKRIKLNIGCGETKLKGYVNIDLEKTVKPDLLLDIRKQVLPYYDETVNEVICFHNIEHIEFKYWNHVFLEIQRVLVPGGRLLLAYPEFAKCAQYFLENHKGLKDFFRATLYGRQLYPGDYHVTPMVSADLGRFLVERGFDEIKYCPEEGEDWNTFLQAVKGKLPKTRENIIKERIWPHLRKSKQKSQKT